jgi:alkylated DNA repair dioxygenase AlkB
MLLFNTKPLLPDGFVYKENFISAEEEKRLVHLIQDIPLHFMRFQGYEAKRKVASFGYNYDFEKRSLSKGTDIPPGFYPLAEKVESALSLPQKSFSELLITEYPVGSVINWHRDAMPFEIVAGVSLLADCLFKLRPYEKEKRSRKSTITVNVDRRSLYIMSGAARYEWQHSIAPVEAIRYSITLRTLKKQL